VEQELLTFPEHLSSPVVFSGVRVARSLVFCISVFVLFLAFVFSVLRFTVSDYPFGISKLFLLMNGSCLLNMLDRFNACSF